MISFEADMDWNSVCKNSKYCLKHKIAKIKEGFLVDHLGGLEEISPSHHADLGSRSDWSVFDGTEDNVHSVR
jgi:hypothetical protein